MIASLILFLVALAVWIALEVYPTNRRSNRNEPPVDYTDEDIYNS